MGWCAVWRHPRLAAYWPSAASITTSLGAAPDFHHGLLGEAIQDYDKAISIMRMGAYHGPPGIGDGHFFRAVARCVQHDWREAKTDIEAARTEGVLVASSFRKIVGGVAKFEANYGLRMPSDVATMLYVDER